MGTRSHVSAGSDLHNRKTFSQWAERKQDADQHTLPANMDSANELLEPFNHTLLHSAGEESILATAFKKLILTVLFFNARRACYEEYAMMVGGKKSTSIHIPQYTV